MKNGIVSTNMIGSGLHLVTEGGKTKVATKIRENSLLTVTEEGVDLPSEKVLELVTDYNGDAITKE